MRARPRVCASAGAAGVFVQVHLVSGVTLVFEHGEESQLHGYNLPHDLEREETAGPAVIGWCKQEV